MKRVYNQLSAKAVDSFTEPGLYLDGGGLYFQITEKGSRSWIYRYSLHGKTRDMGLGSFPHVKLNPARALADDARALVASGVDPIDARRQGRQIAAHQLTVEQAAEAWITAQRPRWKTKKHASHVARRLEQHVFPAIGSCRSPRSRTPRSCARWRRSGPPLTNWRRGSASTSMRSSTGRSTPATARTPAIRPTAAA